jgi:hypothetical protein
MRFAGSSDRAFEGPDAHTLIMSSDTVHPTDAEIADAQAARLEAQETVDQGVANLQLSALADQGTIVHLEAVGVADREAIAELEVDVRVDRAMITDLQAAGVVDRAVITQLELDGIIDRDKIANLEIALVSARRIGGAIGIIMAMRKVTEEQAFTVLREASQASSRKLRDVADAVLATGETARPGDRPPVP